jgi:tRNA G10  N-methylase Trm11
MSSKLSLFVLGRQPALGLAELESIYGSEAVNKLGSTTAIVKENPQKIELDKLGGSIRVADLLGQIPSIEWNDIHDYLRTTISNLISDMPDGKIKFGISVIDMNINEQRLNAVGLSLKKYLRTTLGRSTRYVPNKSQMLNSAQVIHNNLVGHSGLEILILRNNNKTYVAKTSAIQDIRAYADRDQARPKRDAKVGMLPPKLAQLLINFARPMAGQTILDPFCGTGVILQEALLMGNVAYGTDIDPRMISYSQQNLDWLGRDPNKQKLEIADALDHSWSHFDTVASEIYLGRPFAVLPPHDKLTEVISDVDTIFKKFMINLSHQTKAGFRMCIAVPAWKIGRGFRHLPTLDHLNRLGYTRLKFQHVDTEDLIYHRENQIVGREILVLIRK